MLNENYNFIVVQLIFKNINEESMHMHCCGLAILSERVLYKLLYSIHFKIVEVLGLL
jgi:hypothetical protein